MESIEEPNLVLRFRLAGDRRSHVRFVNRMKLDGRGGLLLYHEGRREAIEVGRLRSFSVQSLRGAREGVGSAA